MQASIIELITFESKGVKPFQNQSSVLGADILNNYVLGCQQIDDWVQ